MTDSSTPQVVKNYLRELRHELAGVAADVRHGILSGIAEKLDGLDAAAAASRIESLGDPASIAASARAEGSPPGATTTSTGTSSKRWYLIVTTALIEIGGIVLPCAGWVLGIMMLWVSPLWSRREKFVATLVPPVSGLIVAAIVLVGGSHITAWNALVLGVLVVPVVAGIVIGVVLSRRAWPRAVS